MNLIDNEVVCFKCSIECFIICVVKGKKYGMVVIGGSLKFYFKKYLSKIIGARMIKRR